MTVPVQRRTVGTVLRNHDERILALEREQPASSGGCPCPAIFGEAYKTADQSINNTSYTQLTSWLNWNVPEPTYVDEDTNGLVVETEGYWLLHGYLCYSGLTSVDRGFYGAFEWGGGEPFVDRLVSPVVKNVSGISESLCIEWTGVAYIEAGSGIELWTQHLTTPSAAATITSAYMRLVFLGAASSGFPGF